MVLKNKRRLSVVNALLANKAVVRAYIVTFSAKGHPNHSLDRRAVPSEGLAIVVADRRKRLAAVFGVELVIELG